MAVLTLMKEASKAHGREVMIATIKMKLYCKIFQNRGEYQYQSNNININSTP